ncbi:MAG: 23S rRNA (guanosine(2251)-2'-O)-methyltransferase RlmB [Bacilli bacterium]
MNIYGKNSVYEHLNSKNEVISAVVWEKFSDNKILKLLKEKKIPIKSVKKGELDKIEQGNHQGIILKVPEYEYLNIQDVSFDKENFTIVILDHLEDPHNFGAIIRTCEASGVDLIIIPNDRSVSVTPTAIKTSSGAINNVNICKVNNIVKAIEYLKKEGFWIYALDMNGENYKNVNFDGKKVIIVGNEGSGISNLVRKNSDIIVSLPMVGKINSLNASVATGIMIYEVMFKN